MCSLKSVNSSKKQNKHLAICRTFSLQDHHHLIVSYHFDQCSQSQWFILFSVFFPSFCIFKSIDKIYGTCSRFYHRKPISYWKETTLLTTYLHTQAIEFRNDFFQWLLIPYCISLLLQLNTRHSTLRKYYYSFTLTFVLLFGFFFIFFCSSEQLCLTATNSRVLLHWIWVRVNKLPPLNDVDAI